MTNFVNGQFSTASHQVLDLNWTAQGVKLDGSKNPKVGVDDLEILNERYGFVQNFNSKLTDK